MTAVRDLSLRKTCYRAAMRLLVLGAFILGAAAAANAADVDEAARGIVEKIDELSVQLFLHDAEMAYAEGSYGEARARFDWLAERGSPEARLVLGIMYEEGQGVLHDYQKAFQWYQQAAEQGLAEAQVRLARMYYLGRHVRPDNFLAYVWVSVAASQGDEIALRNRNEIARLMNTHQIQSALALADQWIAKYNKP